MEVSYPMMFALENKSKQRRTHVGVIEFSGVEGKCYVPYWIMTLLGLAEGAFVSVRNLQLPSARLVKFRPQTKDFLDLADPKAFLEHQLRLFACLTKGDTISVYHPSLKKSFLIDVLDLKPANACSIIETDLSVDFAAPLDYVEPTYVRPGASSSAIVTSIDDDDDNNMDPKLQGNSRLSKRAKNDPINEDTVMGGSASSAGTLSALSPTIDRVGTTKIVPFAGSGYRLGGEVGGSSSSSSSTSSNAAASLSSPGLSSSLSPGLGPRNSPSLSGGGIVLGGGGGTGGTSSGGKPRTLNRFEEARRAKAFQGEGQKLL
jgi:hypothetical protein